MRSDCFWKQDHRLIVEMEKAVFHDYSLNTIWFLYIALINIKSSINTIKAESPIFRNILVSESRKNDNNDET